MDYDSMDERIVIFGNLFRVANRLQLTMDQQMPEISAKQWFVLTMLSFFDKPPSLIGLASVCDSSYQNIKQIVLKLQDKGFVRLIDDAKDKRAKCVIMTDKFKEWSVETQKQSELFVDMLFEALSPTQIKGLKTSLLAIYERLGEMKDEKGN